MWKKLKRSVAAVFRRRSVPDTEFPASIARSSDDVFIGVRPGAEQNEILEQWAWQIVHDMRNCLQVISGHGEMLCQTVDENEKLRWHAREIQQAVSQGAELASRLQILAETASLALRELDRNPARRGETAPQQNSETSSQTKASGAVPSCGNACRLFSSSSRTVFWRQLPSLRGPISLGSLNELNCAASIGGLRGSLQC